MTTQTMTNATPYDAMASDETRMAQLVLSRFGLGHATHLTPPTLAQVKARLEAEIQKGAQTLSGLEDSQTILEALRVYRQERAQEKRAEASNKPNTPPDKTPSTMMDSSGENDLALDPRAMQRAEKKAARKADGQQNPDASAQSLRKRALDELTTRLSTVWVDEPTGFAERLTLFWANHFAVSVKKSLQVAALAGAYEREAIRPYVFGKFKDMLIAVETHPAMLEYLDQSRSIGPNSRLGSRSKRGLNENLAREILELHTLGVDGGYQQADVTAFAKVLTGWSINANPQKGRLGYTFLQAAHEPGPQTIMGRSYGGSSDDQGLAVLDTLSRHASTARHIAFKLARHFVADVPPQALVDRLTKVFLDTGGDLAAVSRALLQSKEALSPVQHKLRSPLEFSIAAIRATGLDLKPRPLMSALTAMGQPFWQPGGPNGFPDTQDAWASPEGIASRLDFANSLAQAFSAAMRRNADPRAFAKSALGGLLSDDSAQAIANAETQTQGLAMVLMLPEFQRR